MPSAKCLRALFGFFTILPVRAELDFSCAWALPYTVAPVIGGVAALVMRAAGSLPAYLTLLALTGLNHLDGLADTADALMVRDRERARAALEDPRRGTAGIFAVVISVLFATAYLKSPVQLIAAEVFSKAVAVVFAAFSQAFKEGLGSAYINSVKRRWPLAVPALALLAYFFPAATATALTASLLLYYAAYKHLGGANGDVLGYLLEVSRTAFITLFYINIKM
ncbi:MAG: adenosylcobinamide-GDP ribazoletransferase [Thermoproteus sp. AZ2]|uniref:Adenosylcobinamide-GDP ribazoletransferase n=1 Tax=Thermoproteus sp. AZ2 TaxID=1609232 RepID=A0ACC6UYE0_9CREN|nr:MAG: cobalamin synthase [Thermoproteus sp. AZ2]